MAGPRPQDPYNPLQEVGPTGPPQDYLNVQASPKAFGAEIGQAESGLGKTLEGVGSEAMDVAMKYQQMQNEATANQAVQQYAKFASDREMQLRMQEGQNAVNALPGYQKDMQDELTRMANDIKSPAAKIAFQTDARNFYDRSLYSAGLYVGDQAKKNVVASYNGKIKAVQDYSTLHFQEPGAVASGIQQITDATLSIAHQQGIVDKDAVNSMVSHNVGQLVSSVVAAQMAQGVTLKDQYASLKKSEAIFNELKNKSIPGSPGVPILDAAHQDQLSKEIQSRDYMLSFKIDRQEQMAAAHMAVTVHSNLTNAAAEVERGIIPKYIPTDAQIAAAYPRNPEMAQVVQEQAAGLRDMAHYTSVIPTATPDQIRQVREQVYPDPNKPDFAGQVRRYNAFNTVVNQRAAALKNDPAGYLQLQDKGLAAQFNDALKNPSKLGDYADTVHAHQTALQIPQAQQHFLPQGTAQSIANDISADPNTASQKLKSYQREFGYTWPSAFHDLATLGKLPMEYQSIANLDDRDGRILARVTADKNAGKQILDVLPEVIANGQTKKGGDFIKNQVNSDPTLQQYDSSLIHSGASTAQVAAFHDSVTSLAAGYMYYDQVPAQQAVIKAVKAFTGGSQFIGTARVPTEKFANVTQNAGVTLGKLNENNIKIPSGIGEGVGPTKEEYLNLLKASPTWVTSPKDDALWLMDIGGRIVKDNHGNPVSVPFNAPASGRTDQVINEPTGILQ